MPAVEVMDGDVVRLWFRLAAEALGRTRTAIAGSSPGCEVACYDGGMTSAVLLIGAE